MPKPLPSLMINIYKLARILKGISYDPTIGLVNL